MNKEQELIVKEATKCRDNAYAPYSKFQVGAAILFNDGTLVGGCNVENISYGLSNCAERTAIFRAVAEGKDLKTAKMFCVIGSTAKPISPCGACRQVMAEFFPKDMPVLLANLKGDITETTVGNLLPYSFEEIEDVK